MASTKRELVMSISLNALEHLGINLYSNIPAVLSEIVANAWDADAQLVKVTLDRNSETITIQDDGVGMTRDEVVDRFLTVGFKRRDELGDETPSGRKPMGRKGIGKLSIFSIAQKAQVYTRSPKDKTAFSMDREVIRQAIAANSAERYKPEELLGFPSDLKKGTRIVLSGLSKTLSGMTAEGLRRRIARRFSIIGSKFKFKVDVDGELITPSDRGYHNAVEYLWTYGNQGDFVSSCKHLERPAEKRDVAVKADLKSSGISLTGWIGTVSKPDKLKDEEGDNLNRLAIFMRGKLAQEDVLSSFGQKEIYADYVIGELHCEELDADDKGDIATSSRQSIKQDDPRFESLKKILLKELRYVASRWGDWRRTDGAKEATKVPAVSEWLSALDSDVRVKAGRWIGRLNTIRSPSDSDKRELLKASILAFETYRRKEDLGRLDRIGDENLGEVLDVFRSIDDLELSYYGQIVRGRISVIRTLKQKLIGNEKETLLRDYIFEHLWLLDPSWERVKGTEHAETLVETFLKSNTKSLAGDQKKARIDIGYRTTSGKHLIIELKRSNIAVPLDDLTKQVRKYRDGARKILGQTIYKDWPLEVICLVGKPPPEWNSAGTGPIGVANSLKTVDARLVFYDELLTNSEQAYADYLSAHKKIDKLWGIFDAIENFVPPTGKLKSAAKKK